MKPIYLFLLFLLPGISLSAQSISGHILQNDGKPAEFATVTLHQAQDSSLVKGSITAETGVFELQDVPAGRYFIKADVIGAGKNSSPAFEYLGKTLVLDDLRLGDAAQALGEVTVVARKPVIEVKADKTILNVEGTVNSTGLSALELLRKAPGVTVDNNDNVSIKGKNGVKIMIDGRDVPLDGKDLAAQLKGLQAADIASIEIISNPSARFDAAGNAGIINIRLRKNKALGTNGNVGFEAAYGETPKGGLNLSLNHRAEKLSLFGSYNNHYGRWHNEQHFDREQNGLTFNQDAKSYFMSRWNSARLGADWNINSKHTVGVLVNGNLNLANWHGESRTEIGRTENPGVPDSLLIARNDIDDHRKDLNTNLNYRFADTSGRSLNVDLDHGIYRIRGNSLQPNFYRSADGQTLLHERLYRSITPTDIDITTVKADYEQGLLNGTFSTGFKIAGVRTDNTFDFFSIVNNQEIKDQGLSNRFNYRERTSAGYVNYQRQLGKLHVQAGLRVENTDYTGDLIANTPQDGEKVENNYTELFPSAALTYKFSEKIGLNATYSRRIDRPSYQDLNPFEFKLDELTYQKGNPMLRPQFTNSFELSPTYQGQPVLSLGYSHTKDLFTQVLDTTNVRATFITNENIADQRNYTLTLNVPTPIAKWWEGFFSLTGYHTDFSASFRDGYTAEQAFTAFNLYGEQTLRLPKGFSIQLSGWYNSRAFWGTMRSTAQGAMDLGIQKKVFQDKGEIRLRFGDILQTAGWGGENLFTPGLKMKARGSWESRTVTLNFSYRFGSAEVKGARQRKTGLEDESKRVKSRN
ncbi:MAG: TonB-dependent receptor [Saprospiraceae bacterium]|nr:TonB-dependent receptor [Saprospiraceae bacterium]